MLNKSSKKDTPEEMVLGIDYGEKNIGLAFGRSGLANPGPVISGKNDATAVREINQYIIENKINKIVIGLPLSQDGKETHQSIRVRRFAKLLRVYVKLPTTFIDESNTSNEALESALQDSISQKHRRIIDNISAAIILKKYFREE